MGDFASILFLVIFGGGFAALVVGYALRTRARKQALHAAAVQEALPPSTTKDAETAKNLLVADRVLLTKEVDEARARRTRETLEKQGADDAALVAAKAREVAAKDDATAARQQVQALSHALTKTRDGFVGRLRKAVGGKEIDESIVDDLEAVLFTSDIGAKTAERLLDVVRQKLKADDLGHADRVIAALKTEIGAILDGANTKPMAMDGDAPRVIMIVGVNGAGKTTTIGKLTHHLKSQGKTVLLGAGDTFRAAATEQLVIWGERNDVTVVTGKEQADPASVLFDAVEKGKEAGVDVVLCDTAGRLHTKVNLMEELKKVHRVLGKSHPGAPHEVLLVVDATVGQNAIAQARQFGESVALTGIVLTKLDGTAKGGVVIGIAEELKLPVRFVGVGEKLEDLRPFSSSAFVDALFGSDAESSKAA